MMREALLQLKSPNPVERLRAITTLMYSGDPQALKPLAKVYRNDPNDDVRQAALEAGRYLKKNAVSSAPAAAAEASSPSLSYASEEAVEEEEEEIHVSERDIKRAEAFIDETLTFQLNDDHARAIKSLTKALDANPTLKDDNYFRSLASSVTNLDENEALELVLDQGTSRKFAKKIRKQKTEKRKEEHLEAAARASWLNASIDLVLYGIILTLGFVFMYLVLVQSVPDTTYLEEALASGQLTSEDAEVLQEMLDVKEAFETIGLVSIGSVSGIYGGVNVVLMFLQLVFVHLAAVSVLRGHGNLRYLIMQAMSIYNPLTAVTFLVTYMMIFVIANNAWPIIFPLALVLIIISAWFFNKLIRRIGEAYDFSFVMGCVALWIGAIFFGIANSVLSFALSSVFAGVIALFAG